MALAYVALGRAWILCSDNLPLAMVPDGPVLASIGLEKGLALVLVTGPLRHGLLIRRDRHSPRPQHRAGESVAIWTIGTQHRALPKPRGRRRPEALRDRWATISACRPRSGRVMNRRKDGDHDGVRANVTPLLEDGQPVVAFMSVRYRVGRLLHMTHRVGSTCRP